MSSSPALLSISSSLSFPAATSSVITTSGKRLARQTAIFAVVMLAIVVIICGTILLIWNDNWTTLNCQHLQIRSTSSLRVVRWMFRYFFKTLAPAFQRLGRRATADPRHQPSLPLFTSPRFGEPHLATPRPAMLHDRNSFRGPLNSYSGHPHHPLISPTSPASLAPASSVPLA